MASHEQLSGRLWGEHPIAIRRENGVVYGYEPIITAGGVDAVVRWRWILLWRAGLRRQRIGNDPVDLCDRLSGGRISHQERLTGWRRLVAIGCCPNFWFAISSGDEPSPPPPYYDGGGAMS